MESFHFNNVKAEKQEAMRRNNGQKKLKNFLILLEIGAALALLMANDFLYQNVAVFGPSFHAFMIVNVLVVLIYVSSSQRPTKPDIYDEYVSITTTTTVASTNNNIPRRTVNAADDSQEPEQPVVEKQIVCVEYAVTSTVHQNTMPSLTVRDCEKKKQMDIFPVGAVTERDKNYRRSRSERFEKENRRDQLRRSGTVVKREMMAVSNEPARRSSAIDDLSSEEFRLTIETFISSRKRTLIRENSLDLNLERKERMAITLSACN